MLNFHFFDAKKCTFNAFSAWGYTTNKNLINSQYPKHLTNNFLEYDNVQAQLIHINIKMLSLVYLLFSLVLSANGYKIKRTECSIGKTFIFQIDVCEKEILKQRNNKGYKDFIIVAEFPPLHYDWLRSLN